MKLKFFLLTLLVYGVIFVASLLISFAFFFAIIYKLSVFKIVDSSCVLIVSVVLSVLASILITVIWGIDSKRKKQNKFLFFIKNNAAKLILAYIIIDIIAVSIRNTPLWEIQEIGQVLSIEWTIFGLSITIFLVWNIIIVEYLKKKQPIETEKIDFKQKYNLLLDKQFFHYESQCVFTTIIILTINLFFLIVATAYVYIFKKPESLFTQNLIICAFYFSTNSLISLFLDILRPLKDEEKKILSKNKVNIDDLSQAQIGAQIQARFEDVAKLIYSQTNLSDQEKEELFTKFVNSVIGSIKNNSKNDRIINDTKRELTNDSATTKPSNE